MTASYLAMDSGILQERIERSLELLMSCRLCPRQCGVDRFAGEKGYCRTGRFAEVASYGPHFGEEQVLVGTRGSGTIFFCGCNLLCNFCQNYEISRVSDPDCQPVSDEKLAAIMVELQEAGCHNINFVTPTHVMPQILAALPHAIRAGLRVPLVYNCGGYERVESLQLLDRIVDIYMPDTKFWDSRSGLRYANAPDYPEKMKAALAEIQRQVGDLRLDAQGLAEQGLLVRHLLMPGGLAEGRAIFHFLAKEISPNCYVNIMDQYRPCGEAALGGEGGGMIESTMYNQAIRAAKSAGLSRLDQRDLAELIRRLMAR
ncbi:MAG: radical SAM protein [Desulfobulbaceae bacterium BRH_c16a]|nr:MAG: radical SAM protein [Desulfobulbaceae bacterium BRH_c16a]